MRRIGLVFAAIVAAAFGDTANAEEPRSPATQIAAEIDKYLQAPRSAATYRALANMGDPSFMTEVPADRYGFESPLLTALDMSYTNCRWRYSDEVYRKRLARLGERHPYIRQWLDVQRAVFSRCHGYGERHADPIPAAMPTSDERIAALQAEDRAYQKAAALFYEQGAAARAAFAAIAARRGEHQPAAKLMVASIDAGSEPSGYADAKSTPATIAEAQKLLNDPTAKPVQADAHALIGWIGASGDTLEGRRAQVKVTLEALALPLQTIRTDKQAEARYYQAAQDLPKLFTDFDNDDWWVTGAVPRGYFGSQAMAEAATLNSMAAFALSRRPATGSSASYDLLQIASKHFDDRKEDRDAWRVATLQLGSYYNRPGVEWAEIDALLAKVAARPTDHDVAMLAFLFDHKVRGSFDGQALYDESQIRLERSVAMLRLADFPYKNSENFRRLYYHGLNALILAQDIVGARRLRDLIEPKLDQQFGYSWIVSSDLLLLLAENEEAMVNAIVERGGGDSTLLNRLPARDLARLAIDQRIDPKIRARFARVAWTRDYVLGRKIPKAFDALMRTLNPAIGSNWKSRVGARPGDHALLLDLLNTPAMNLRVESRIEPTYGPRDEVTDPLELDYYEHSRNNWWCAPDTAQQTGREEDALANSVEQIPRGSLEALLSKSHLWQSLDRSERERLSAIPNAPNVLSNAAIAWAKKASAKKPKGADEALARAVRSTRYGCQMNGSHGAYSKTAWDLLHQKFPLSDAARRTRWWFDCKHFTYGCSDKRNDDQTYVDLEAWEADIKRQIDENAKAQAQQQEE